jgi:hypothetical protein
MRLKSPIAGSENSMVRRLLSRALIVAGLLALAGAPSALADTNRSSNWAGYAIHRSRVAFTKVSAVWRQPSATCRSGSRTYSAYWVGLGGYGRRSTALEQIGTEVDCNAAGQVRSSAWYELVPAASKTIRFRVQPGDLLGATVTVTGHRVLVALDDRTSGKRFRKVLHAREVDVSSAEWIVEAPSDCVSDTACQTLPLADFGSAAFGLTYATTTAGHTGSISDRRWRWSKISLVPGGQQFVAAGSSGSAGEAIPSALAAGGAGFGVSYSAVQAAPFASARQASLGVGRLVHPPR